MYHDSAVFSINGDFAWRVSDCEESVGVTYNSWHTTLNKILIHGFIIIGMHCPI